MLAADAHSDLLEELAFAENRFSESNPFRSCWLPPLEDGEVALQVCAIYADPGLEPDARLVEVLRQARSFHRAVAGNSGSVVAVRRAADLEGLGRGRIGLLLSLEGASALERQPWLIELLAELGLRMASLTWNERNAFAAGSHEKGGLTRLGEQLADRILELGMALDLAHASRRTFFDALERDCAGRVLVSHAACRAILDHPRNLADDQLVALAERDGVLGLMPHPMVVDEAEPTLERFVLHIDHAAAVMGTEHIAIGGDYLRQIMRAMGRRTSSSKAGPPTRRSSASKARVTFRRSPMRCARLARDDDRGAVRWQPPAVAAPRACSLSLRAGAPKPTPSLGTAHQLPGVPHANVAACPRGRHRTPRQPSSARPGRWRRKPAWRSPG